MQLNKTYFEKSFLLTIYLVASLFSISRSTCGYQGCPVGKPDMLNVHIIMHTHDDVGWLHTVDNYYEMWVNEIITSVVNSLVQNENRRFIYVELAFFTKWWDEQSDLTKDIVRRLVNDGRLEFTSGGWSMNDEATTHYSAIIDQMTLGLRWLNQTFGTCGIPKVGWQIDPFGHSREQASLFSQMYFDGLFLGRIHYQDKTFRETNQNLEFLWKTSQSLDNSELFTGVLPNVYWPPTGFCFDTFCSDDELTEENINYRSQSFISIAGAQAKFYGTKHTVMTMGMDFHFRDSVKWFRNMDFLISFINSLQAVGLPVNAFYSTPACYLYNLNSVNTTWSTMESDFFPYASNKHELWTGYFTSRPTLKYYARKSNSLLQICKQLVTFSNVENADFYTLQKALGVIQHHDGITGTEKQHVADDYTKMLSEGTKLCNDAIGKSTQLLLSNDTALPKIHFCDHLNVSKCSFTEMENQFVVIVYNSLAHPIKTYVRLPVVGESFSVRQVAKRRRLLPTQVLPIPPSVISLPERSSLATNELIFPVALPPLGFSLYGVKLLGDYEPVADIGNERFPLTIEDSIIENENFQVIIDGFSGLLKEIVLLETNISVPIKQSYYFYEGMPGYRLERASGAYAFNPQHDAAYPLAANVTYRVFKGSLVEEIHQYFSPWLSQVIRVYKGKNYIEFDWVVGPIPVYDHIGREVIIRFDTKLHNHKTFYTDSNSRETMKRIRNHQDTFPWNVTEKIAGNYYPVTSWIYLQDKDKNLQLSLLPDRAEGGGSIHDGSLELMLHRRLLFDDGFGVNEALNEPGFDGRGLVARGSLFLTLGKIEKMIPLNKRLAKMRFQPPFVSFAKTNPFNMSRNAIKDFRGLKRRLPGNVHILTLEKLDTSKVLLRLEHFHEKADGIQVADTVSVSLYNLFRPFRVLNYVETTLSANQYLYEAEKLEWKSNEGDDITVIDTNQDDLIRITLKPMQIRTFILTIDYNL